MLSPKELYAAGITDLIEIAAGEKFPTHKGWRTYEASELDVRRWELHGSNVGLRAGRFPGVDIDVLNLPLVQFITDHFHATLGPSPIRLGKVPKVLLPYRLEGAPFTKRVLEIAGHGKVEILAEGQQYVVWGRHPEGATYKWAGSAELTPVSVEAMDMALELLRGKLELAGYEAGSGSALSSAQDVAPEQAPSLEALRALVEALPNDELPYDDWCAIGHAIKGALPDDATEEDGLEIFVAWSEKSQKHIPQESERVFRAAKPRHAGWQSLMGRAQRTVPTAAAQAEFTPVHVEGAEAAPTYRAMDTGEELSALLRSAEKPFILESKNLMGDALLNRWHQLERAANTPHRLGKIFDAVAPLAAKLDRYALDKPRFIRLLQTSPIADAPLFKYLTVDVGLNAGECALLYEAAWLDATQSAALHEGRALRLVREIEQVDMLVDEIAPAGWVIGLVGPPGKGKTWVAAAMALAAARGGRFAGKDLHATGPVWYFTSEFAEGVKERLMRDEERLGPAPHLFLFDTVPNLESASSVMGRLLEAASMTEAPAPKLVIIDVFRAATRGDENDSGVVSLAMQNARLFAKATGAVVLVVHHTSKERPDDPRGSIAFEAECDALYTVAQRPDKLIVMQTRKHRRGLDLAQGWRIVDGVLEVEEGFNPVDEAVERERMVRKELARRVAASIWKGESMADVTKRMMENGMDYGKTSARSLRRYIGEVLEEFSAMGWVKLGRGGTAWEKGDSRPPEASFALDPEPEPETVEDLL